MAFFSQADLPLHDRRHEPSPPLPVWSPEDDGIVLDFGRLAQEIRQVELPGSSSDPVVRLKATGVGKFYARHLKQYPLVRGLVNGLWRKAYLVCLSRLAIYFHGRKARHRRHLTKLRDFVKAEGIPTIQLTDAALVETPAPKVFPARAQGCLASPHDRYHFPPVYVATVSDGMIYGGTNLVLKKEEVVCHDLYDFEHDQTGEELYGRNLIEPGKGRIRWLLHDKSPGHLPVAAAFVDACASNYAHWLTEVLPRIAAFCAEEQFKSVPMVVNGGLHKNIMESLFLMAGAGRKIVTLAIGRALQVDLLYLTSVAGYVPFERRDNKLSGHSHGVFSPRALELIREKASAFAEKLPEQAWPEKIYLRRKSGARRVTNAAELEELLTAAGYAIVEPEKLTFLQQVKLFSRAKKIIGSSGAALANMVFAPADADIFVLIGNHPDTSYWYWQNIACASGKRISYILGEMVNGKARGIHADITVDLPMVLRELGKEL